MVRVWCLLCFFFGSGLTSNDVHQSDGSLLEDGESALKDTPTAGVMLVRLKRSPSRTMSISGYMPNGGLSYASTDVMFPYQSMGYPGGMDMWPYPNPQPKSPSKDLQPPSRSDTYRGPEEGPPPVIESEPSWPEKEVGNGNTNGMTTYSVPKKSKKKQPFHKVSPSTTADEDEEEGGRDGTAKAHASFNAWFPIMLGVFPYGQGGGGGGGGGGGPGEAAQKGAYPPTYPSQGSHGSHTPQESQSSGPSHSQSPLQRYYSTTVIANSVNNGRSGIASSTATAYGGEQPQQQPKYNA